MYREQSYCGVCGGKITHELGASYCEGKCYEEMIERQRSFIGPIKNLPINHRERERAFADSILGVVEEK